MHLHFDNILWRKHFALDYLHVKNLAPSTVVRGLNVGWETIQPADTEINLQIQISLVFPAVIEKKLLQHLCHMCLQPNSL